jgi:hypothetical protein
MRGLPLWLPSNIVEHLAVEYEPVLGAVLHLFICPAAQSLSNLLQGGAGNACVWVVWCGGKLASGFWGLKVTDRSNNVLDS